ncbi:MAG: DUF429 domain-containing protein [Archaeoglobaceae archaeon]
MIKSTFVFIPGIGRKTEEDFWKKGILTWHDLKKNFSILSRERRQFIYDYLDKADSALSRDNLSFFVKHLPQNELWRVYREFKDKTVFLDIETTGLSSYYDWITLIGAYDGKEYNVFVRDNNMEDFVDYLSNYNLIVTFNGKTFDIPFLKKEFPEIKIPSIHIDLKYLLRSVGITGPLKQIEEEVGIRRPGDLQEVSGREAAVLWRQFLKGDDEALEKLIRYNYQDTVNLQTLMHFCYNLKLEQIKSKMNCDTYQQTLLEYGYDSEELFREYVFFTFEPSTFDKPKIHIQKPNESALDVHMNGRKLARVDRNKIEKIEIKIENLLQKIERENPVAVGIDLSGSEKRNSGVCVLGGKDAYLDALSTDEEIISTTLNAKPDIISIDSPLSLPEGRCCPEDTCDCRQYGITRGCERTLKKRGINVYPCLIKSMQKLTMRGIKLAEIFRKEGYDVIESYPGAAQDIMGLPRKRINLKELEVDLWNMGVKPFSSKKTITHDEIDALTSALVGYFYLAEEYEAIGNNTEGYLMVPDLNNSKRDE